MHLENVKKYVKITIEKVRESLWARKLNLILPSNLFIRVQIIM